MNEVYLLGVIGNDIKYATAINGENYCTFTLCINSYSSKDPSVSRGDSSNAATFLRIFVYGDKTLEYLHSVKARKGNMAFIRGRLNSHGSDIKGKQIIQINVVVREIRIIKGKKQMKAVQEAEQEVEQEQE